ncbi:toxin-antitoxin system YwqK family antitoxin [Limnobaculum xujianqingii]|uniref:toxin-antitoxin system YwqK family antitoxin n=1 Tax=Limnobaculum xujianqingii TaxID=2738837 RepID=UPI00112AE36B|nr:toxin-antitoxin system YwqK family antitoxin [Limnobaculum xujianqingii]
MRRILLVIFSLFIFSANAEEMEHKANMMTAPEATWKKGDKVAEYLISLDNGFFEIDRQFLGITKEGFYQVQDFYQKDGRKFTDPFLLKTQQGIPQDWMEFMDLSPAVLSGDYFQYHADGSKMVEIKSTGLNSYQKKSWYNNGQLQSQVSYENGKQEGMFTFWHANGKKLREGELLHGKHNGVWKSWHENGVSGTEVRYINGVLDGETFGWHENGQKYHQGMYRNGNAVGMSYVWDQDGNLVEEKDNGGAI